MYRPRFCSNCGTKVIRLRWHPWTSRRFCDPCAARFRKDRLLRPIATAILLFSAGLVAGRSGRPAPPPLTIERVNPLSTPGGTRSTSMSQVPNTQQAPDTSVTPDPKLVSRIEKEASSEVVYLCGARTKKGTPCQRRVQGPVRCWQHKGMPAMLPQEKLMVK